MPNPYRLSYDFEPILYTIELTPDIEKFTFSGHERIALKTKKDFSSITLHSLDLKISKAFVETGLEKIDVKKVSFDTKMETVTFTFPKKIKASKEIQLIIHFAGELNDKMHGFYRTSYKVNGVTRWGAATQFEATDARRCFPCWDEPDRKAKFKATLTVPRHLTALSNMPAVSTELISGSALQKISYEISPIMPTYLLAFVVADLECVEAKDKNGVTIRVWTTPGKKEQGRFGLNVACHALAYFAEWFDIPYALPKLDQVALPDFASGAMENWGLVTYRETALLVDEKNSSASAKQRVAEVVDHELAHQWFGNLVTMEWWTDLWLNEGFASYMGPKAVDNQFPEWDTWTQYVVTEHLTALHDDSLKNTHPIEIDVKNPHEIREIFDHITYSKGSVVNRMLEHYLGEELFQEGLRIYLKRYAYKNAKTMDLWKALEEVSQKPVQAIMASFTRQGGYPILKVSAERKSGKAQITLSQKRFLFDGSSDPSKLQWKIPFSINAKGLSKSFQDVMTKPVYKLDLNVSDDAWIKTNPNQSGFYRTAYDKNLLKSLLKAVEDSSLSKSAIEYLGIADDASALARAGVIKTSECLNILFSMKHATDYNIWVTVISSLRQIESLVADADLEKYQNICRDFIRLILNKMGWEERSSDSHTDILLRSLILANLGHFLDEAVIAEGRKRFEYFVKAKELAPNIRYAVYAIVAENGGVDEFEKLIHIYKKSELQEEKVRVLRALVRFKDQAVIQKVLAFALSKDVRNQDTYVILAGFGGNSTARRLNWDYVKKNWKILSDRYKGSSVSLLGHILEGSVSGFHTAKDMQEVQRFFKAHPVKGTERVRKQSLELIASNIEWLTRDQNDIRSWIQRRG